MSPSLRHYLGRRRDMRGYQCQIELQYAAEDVEITRGMPCIVGVKNLGDQTWQAGGRHPVHLSYHWHIGSSSIEGLRFALPADVRPGEQAVIECGVLAPAEEGEYELEFDLVREHVGWFKQNSATTRIARRVNDYDYHVTYRQADLNQDYWTIVGPATRQQYEHLGRQKRQTLIELGMTPQSRVLDVGCGTGQLTEALVDYLADEGAYCGTDIVADAVRFCCRKFHRTNFSFVQNEMTRVPIDGRQFDLIYLASVFTHMYPLEIQAMLLDLKRLLAPGGLIMADVFVTPSVATSAGSRSKVEINEDYLKGLFAETGLACQLQGTIVQPAGGKRLGFILRER